MHSSSSATSASFTVRTVSPDDFTAWARATRGVGPTLDAAGYTALARQSGKLPSATYGAVAPGLFDQVVQHAIAPGPGPATERGGAAEATPKSH